VRNAKYRRTSFGGIIPVVWFNTGRNWYPHCSIRVFSDILVSTWWWPTQKRAETCSWFLQQFENTVVLWRTFIHLISTSTKERVHTYLPYEYFVAVFMVCYCFRFPCCPRCCAGVWTTYTVFVCGVYTNQH
jgi:hypothetical protein